MSVPIDHLLAILAGVSVFIWGLCLWLQRQWLLRNGQFTTGTVIGHDDGPIVRFYAQDQQPILFKPSASPSRRYHLNGASIGIYYNPENPQDAVLDTTEHKLLPFLLMLTGIAFMIGALS